jgi:MinD-like ATPase involved in chromosome partitioning or flagellar assembly
MRSKKNSGQVITFYSYKGGTGRSMALANVACLLAKQHATGKGVLMVDWDLEAPGLHRFFRNRIKCSSGLSNDQELDVLPGLIDLFLKYQEEIQNDEDMTEETALRLFEHVNFDQFILETNIPALYLLKSGCFDEKYSSHVNTFQWEALYNRAPWLIRSFAEQLAERYQYVLIDSRTGLTDISGICTMLMPQKLVVVFTPNRQSLLGVLDLTRRATNYRKQSDDLRPLIVFPLPSRIEAAEPTLRTHWRFGNTEQQFIGYQPQFEGLFQEVYNLPSCSLEAYFNEVQIQHVPRYAYGEEVAVLVEQSGDRLSLARSYENFTERLLKLSKPWEDLSAPIRQKQQSKVEKTSRIDVDESSEPNAAPLETDDSLLRHLLGLMDR